MEHLVVWWFRCVAIIRSSTLLPPCDFITRFKSAYVIPAAAPPGCGSAGRPVGRSSLRMHAAAALSSWSRPRRSASVPPRPRPSCDSTPLVLLARARAARDHPTISFRPGVRPCAHTANHGSHTVVRVRWGLFRLRGAPKRPYASDYRSEVPGAAGHRTTVRGSHQPFHHCRSRSSAQAAATQRWTPIKRPSARRSSSCSPTRAFHQINDRPAVTCI